MPFGGSVPVRLGKLLAAAGVPRLARARWPVLARPGRREILWLIGVRRAAAAPLTVRPGRRCGSGAVIPAPESPSGPAPVLTRGKRPPAFHGGPHGPRAPGQPTGETV